MHFHTSRNQKKIFGWDMSKIGPIIFIFFLSYWNDSSMLQWCDLSPVNMDLWAYLPKCCFLVLGNLTTISMIHNWPTQRPRPWFASQRTAYSLFQQSHNCSYTSWSRGRWKKVQKSKGPKLCYKLKQMTICVQILQSLLQNKKEKTITENPFGRVSLKV